MEFTNLAEAIMEALTSKGWRFERPEEMAELFEHVVAEEGHQNMDRVQRAAECKLLNMDLKSFGGKSLPDALTMKKISLLQGPLILQAIQSRDIYRSGIHELILDEQSRRRLLRLTLTDGHTDVVAIEYTPTPSISDAIIPGTKILLENKIVVRNGILCLNSKVVRVIGGVVHLLFDEWNMSRKYSGFSRSQATDGQGPPPFEKLQFEAYSSWQTDLRDSLRTERELDARKESHYKKGLLRESMTDTGNARKSDQRSKEVVEAIPVQNQAAAQKLLQKLNQPNLEYGNRRGGRHRGRGREEAAVFTLDEWERSKAGTSKPAGSTSEAHDTSCDEELARRLQSQLDMEDVRADSRVANQLMMNMFNYGKPDESSKHGREYSRSGRGRRGQGRGRGRF